MAASLKSVFVYDESINTLRLKKGISSAPWLHFTTVAASSSNESLPTRGAGRHSLCMKDSWWYCNTCFQYWLPSSKTGEYFNAFRIFTNAYASWQTLAKRLVPSNWDRSSMMSTTNGNKVRGRYARTGMAGDVLNASGSTCRRNCISNHFKSWLPVS